MKGLFTWSGGPRSSGVGFFCFHALGDTKQKKLTPLDRGPPLHVNRVLVSTKRDYVSGRIVLFYFNYFYLYLEREKEIKETFSRHLHPAKTLKKLQDQTRRKVVFTFELIQRKYGPKCLHLKQVQGTYKPLMPQLFPSHASHAHYTLTHLRYSLQFSGLPVQTLTGK